MQELEVGPRRSHPCQKGKYSASRMPTRTRGSPQYEDAVKSEGAGPQEQRMRPGDRGHWPAFWLEALPCQERSKGLTASCPPLLYERRGNCGPSSSGTGHQLQVDVSCLWERQPCRCTSPNKDVREVVCYDCEERLRQENLVSDQALPRVGSNLLTKLMQAAGTVGVSQVIKLATKSPAEKEDEAIEDLSRPAPKKKPPRHDLRKERVDTDDEKNEFGAEGDRDLSLNYKRVASRWVGRVAAKKRQTKKNIKKNPLPRPRSLR